MAMSRGSMRQQVTRPPQKKKWSQARKKKINCANPKGFSQRAYCAGKRKRVK